MNKLAIVMSGIVLGVSFNACAQSTIVVQSGNASVTQADVATVVRSLSQENRQRLAADPAQLDGLVRSQLASKAMYNEAKAKGWDQQPKVKQAVELAEREAVVGTYLVSVSTPPASYPSEAEMHTAYEQQQAAFTVTRMLHLAQIYIAAAPHADEATLGQARKAAADVARKAQAAGADFAALAKANSQDRSSAPRGGDMGYIAADQMVPVIGPIQTSDGFYIVKVIDVRPAGVAPYVQVKEQIRVALRQQRARAMAQSYMTKAVGTGEIKIDEAALGKALSMVQ
jgi:parvulin-like peptidyl-prolyl isomerase